MIDWTKPIIAFSSNKEIPVSIDKNYHKTNLMPVKFPFNIWVERAEAGTWYVTDEGLIGCAITSDGYECKWKIKNHGPIV